MNHLADWARRWNVPPAAVAELTTALTAEAPTLTALRQIPRSEADIVGLTRLEASRHGMMLWRNNVGAMYDADRRLIRYGLGNDSKKYNDAVKSSDLIGIRPIVIDITHIGRTLGQFVAIECKRPGWKWPKTPSPREAAQQKFHTIIESVGGFGLFTSTGSVE